MTHHIRLKTPILVAAAAMLLATLACNLVPPANPATPLPSPAATEPPPPSPTATATPVASVNPEQAIVGTSFTDDAGRMVFADPLQGAALALTAFDEATGQPVPGLQVWIMTVGTEVLVITWDPNRIYAPSIEEISYSELSPDFAVDLIVFAYESITKSAEDWYTYFLIYPDLDEWAINSTETCSGPLSSQPGLGGAEGTRTLMANFPVEATLTFSILDYIPASQAIAEDLIALGDESPVVQGYINQPPALVRWEILTLHGDIPTLARPTEFCLEPLDRSDPQAILDWVQFGLDNSELEVFEILAFEGGVGYTNYLEGGQPNTPEAYLADLAARLPSGASCDGYSFSDPWFQIWASGWAPAWEITELCYVECQPQDPPYTSDLAGFFFRPLEDDGWTLQTMWLNDASLWEEVYGAEVRGCEVPVDLR